MKYLFACVCFGLFFTGSALAGEAANPGLDRLPETAEIAGSGDVQSGIAPPGGFPASRIGYTNRTRFCTAADVAILPSASGRPDAGIARARIESMGDAAISVLRNGGMSKQQRLHEFRALLKRHFQLHAIGALALGRHRASATPRQLKEFNRLFSEFVVIRVAELLDDYANERFRVNDVIEAGRRDVAVRSRIVPERGDATDVYWVMREFNGRPLIIDVRVNNISLVITQRDEFNAVIHRAGMEALLDRLRNQVNRLPSEDAP